MRVLCWCIVLSLFIGCRSGMAWIPQQSRRVVGYRGITQLLNTTVGCKRDPHVVATSTSHHNSSPIVSSGSISLRNATLDDLDTILRWDDQPYLNDPNTMGDPDYNDWDWEVELGRHPTWRYQLVAELKETDNSHMPIGIIQIIDPALEESHYWGIDCPRNLRAIDIWIGEPDYLSKGYGTSIMATVLRDYCFCFPEVVAVLVDPMVTNPRAHNFYQRLGFEPEEKRHFGPDECLVHRLTRQSYKKMYGKTNIADNEC